MKRANVFPVIAAFVLALSFFSTATSGETRRFGSMTHNSEVPGALFLTGDIESGDSFELRKAMREFPIDLVVLGSRGGNLYEGLQIASILHDNGIDTYLPANIECESSCANIFFAGAHRLAVGNLGVHQFYSSAQDAGAARSADATTSATQYTTADIIGIMNAFETPAFVYERMFGTDDIYYFSEAEKPRLNRGADEPGFLGRVAQVDSFISSFPAIMQRPSTDPVIVAAPAPPVTDTAPAPEPVTESTYADIDFFGMDLSPQGVRGVSLFECETICRQTSSCAAFSYVKETRWCWPKSAVENVSAAPGTVSGIIDFTRVNMAALQRPFVEVTGADIRGYDLLPKGMKDMTLDQCRRACEGTPQCRAFSWLAKKNWCFPKYGFDRFTEQLGTISGIRN